MTVNEAYRVLGASPEDSKDILKQKYRRLAKKHHPDLFTDPLKKAKAEEEIKQINQAYDVLSNPSANNAYDNARGYYSNEGGQYYSQGYNTQSEYNLKYVYTLIELGYYDKARQVLDMIQTRPAEWYYLSAVVHYRIGWYTNALRDISQAMSMEPDNQTYKDFAASMQQGYSQNQPFGNTNRNSRQCMQCLSTAFTCFFLTRCCYFPCMFGSKQ